MTTHQDGRLNTTTFQQVRERWPWRPIPDCPGRFVLSPRDTPSSFKDLLGHPCSPQMFVSPKAKDPVMVCSFEDGGLISYQQPNGGFIHTLNTREGFQRKCQQLEIAWREIDQGRGIPP